jgi:predicted chitinase
MTDWILTLVQIAKAAAPGAHPQNDVVKPMASVLPAVFKAFGINNARRQAHFLAQCCVESDYFRTCEEYASGRAYEGRIDLGNNQRGDGTRFKGRGPIQITGRKNYLWVQARLREVLGDLKLDLLAHPELLANGVIGTWAAGAWWERNKVNTIADRDPTGSMVSRLVNRGDARSKHAANAEHERLEAYEAAVRVLSKAETAAVAAEADERLVPRLLLSDETDAYPAAGTEADPIELTRTGPATGRNPGTQIASGTYAPGATALPAEAENPGSPPVPLPAEPVAPGLPEYMVKAAQGRLRELGWYSVGYVDGQPGDAAVGAVAAYQNSRGLSVTGQLDADTVAELGKPQTPRVIGAARANQTIATLRAGSETIQKADKAIRTQAAGLVAGLGGLGISGLSSLLGDNWTKLATVREMFADVPGWVWGTGVVIMSMATIVYSRDIQNRRVDDERTGKHVGTDEAPPPPDANPQPAGDPPPSNHD